MISSNYDMDFILRFYGNPIELYVSSHRKKIASFSIIEHWKC